MSDQHPAAASAHRPAWLEQLKVHRYLELVGGSGASAYSSAEFVKLSDVLAACPPQPPEEDSSPVTVTHKRLAEIYRMLGEADHADTLHRLRTLIDVELAACPPPAAEDTFEGHRLDCHKISNSSRGERYLSADACTCAAASPPPAEARDEKEAKAERVFQAVVYAYEGLEVPQDLEEHGMVKRARKYRQAQAAGRAPGRPEAPTP